MARFNYFLWLLLNLRKPLKRLIQHSQELSKATADADPASCSWFSKQIKYRAFACVLPFIEIFEAVKWWIVLLWDGIFRCNPDGFKVCALKTNLGRCICSYNTHIVGFTLQSFWCHHSTKMGVCFENGSWLDVSKCIVLFGRCAHWNGHPTCLELNYFHFCNTT